MAWQFNGVNSAAYVPSGEWTLFSTDGWTISFWFKIYGTGTSAHQHWFFHRSGASLTDANTIGTRINETSNIITALYRSDNNQALDVQYDPGTTNEWTSSGWVHLVQTQSRRISNSTINDATDDYSIGRLYVNGVLADTDNTHTGFDAANLGRIVFGKIGNASTNRTLSGALAEFVKWDRVITSTEVAQLYAGHSPLYLNPTFYFPMRNDYVERIIGFTGIGINNVPIISDHPIGAKQYIPVNEYSTNTSIINNRLGQLEQKGYVDFIDWAPGQIVATGCAQSGLMFSQARLGEAYQVAGNGTLSGCIATAQVDTSGLLTISVRNPGLQNVTVGVTRWNIYRI